MHMKIKVRLCSGIFRTKFIIPAHDAVAKVNSALLLVGLGRVKQ